MAEVQVNSVSRFAWNFPPTKTSTWCHHKSKWAVVPPFFSQWYSLVKPCQTMARPGKNDRFGRVAISLVEDIPTDLNETWVFVRYDSLSSLNGGLWNSACCRTAKARLVHPQHDGLARIFGPGKLRWVMYPLEQKHGINMRYFRFTACYGMYMPVWQLYECKHISYTHHVYICIQYAECMNKELGSRRETLQNTILQMGICKEAPVISSKMGQINPLGYTKMGYDITI